jgi:hypothetical protein
LSSTKKLKIPLWHKGFLRKTYKKVPKSRNRKMQLVNSIYKNNFKRQIKTISDNLQIYIKEPLKEVLLLINLLATNEDKNDNLVLISEIKNFIKTLFNDFDNILKCSFDITKQMTICKN